MEIKLVVIFYGFKVFLINYWVVNFGGLWVLYSSGWEYIFFIYWLNLIIFMYYLLEDIKGVRERKYSGVDRGFRKIEIIWFLFLLKV